MSRYIFLYLVMASQTIENYLKALYNLSNDVDEINVTDLANSMDVSLPSVNSMVKKLAKMGLILYEKYKPLQITELGKKEAALIIRKHRLTEMYLVEKMGFGWDEVHHIAEHIEHLKSPEFFDRIDELLGFPTHDPHGSPIPDKSGQFESMDLHKLSDCEVGDKVVVKALGYTSEEFLKFLNSKDFALNLQLKILAIEPFDNSMTLSYAGHPEEVFSEKVCEKLLVKV